MSPKKNWVEPEVHSGTSGAAHFSMPNEQAALALVRELISHIPQNNLSDPPRQKPSDSADRLCPALDKIIPPSASMAYDIKEVITEVADDGQVWKPSLILHQMWSLDLYD